MISIIDYGLGNVKAFKAAYDSIGIDNEIIESPKKLINPTHIIIPGVGSFDQALKSMNKIGFTKVLNEYFLSQKVKFLGVCVGLQVMCKSSEEGNLSGFEWINANVKKIDRKNKSMKIPHMGWTKINVTKECPLLKNIDGDNEFYFLHSYNVFEDTNLITSSTINYGSDLIASISKGNIFGTQFHPEKSHDLGLKILKNFSLT
jgi:imidazole glycerol-phosphate synthase subunit HisH